MTDILGPLFCSAMAAANVCLPSTAFPLSAQNETPPPHHEEIMISPRTNADDVSVF